MRQKMLSKNEAVKIELNEKQRKRKNQMKVKEKLTKYSKETRQDKQAKHS